MGVFLTVAGGLLLATPPGQSLGWPVWAMGGLVVLAGAASLLPVTLVGMPNWYHSLETASVIPLPRQISLDPAVSLFWLLLLASSVLIVLYLLSCPQQPDQLSRVAVTAVIGCSVFTMLSWYAYRTEWNYPFFVKDPAYPVVFGFFPNRNHTAGFLLTGAILSAGLLHASIKRGKYFLAMLSVFCFALLSSSLLLFSKSRAGLIFLCLGMVIWLIGLGKQRPKGMVLWVILLAMFMGILFLNSESPLLQRLKGEDSGSLPVHSNQSEPDARWGIALDTFPMIRDRPLTGWGMGAYPILYPLYADKSLRYQTTALHAESDWLTLAAEAGLPIVLLLVGCIVLLMRRIPELEDASAEIWPLRCAFLASFFAEVLHSFVDVPFHRVELGWWILLLGGIGFASPAPSAPVNRFQMIVQRFFFMLGGAGMILFGGALLLAQWGGGRNLPPFESSKAQQKVLGMYAVVDSAHIAPVYEECTRLLGLYPLNSALMRQYAIFLFQEKTDLPKASSLFAAERLLLPKDPGCVFVQGWILADSDPKQAASLWKDAIIRQMAMDGSPNHPIRRTGELFHSMMGVAREHPLLLAEMSGVAAVSPETRMIWLQQPARTFPEIEVAASDSGFMGRLSPKERGKVVELLWNHGEGSSFLSFMEAHPDYAGEWVPSRGLVLAASGRQEEACRLILSEFRIPVRAIKPGRTREIQAAGSNIPSDPLEAALFYLDRGNLVAARRLLAEVHTEEPAKREKYLLAKADLEMEEVHWADAFRVLMSYLEVTGNR